MIKPLSLLYSVVTAAIVTAATAAPAWAQVVDTFHPGANGDIFATALQPDGKIVVGGDFTFFGCDGNCPPSAVARSRIARLNADGSVDTTFDPGANGIVNAIVVQPDGKIVVAGNFQMMGGGGTGSTSRNRIARLNADGSLDVAFNPGSNVNNSIYALALQADGKILVGGGFYAGLGGGVRYYFGRLNADGTLDAGFSPGVDGPVQTIAVQADGKILVGGLFTHIGGQFGDTPRSRIGRFNADGTVDLGFDPGANQRVDVIAVQGDGRILVGGFFTGLGGSTGSSVRQHIGRVNADGSLDATFDPGASAIVYTLAEQTDGRILVGGDFLSIGGGGTGSTPRNRIARLNGDGSVDATFNPGTNNTVYAITIQGDGKVLVGGTFQGIGNGTGDTIRRFMARLNPVDPATQSIVVSGGGTVVTWLRGGSSPEAWRTEFAASTDGINYTPIGVGVRVAGGWQVTGFNLPVYPNLTIRARAYVPTGWDGSSSSIIEYVAPVADFNLIENPDFSAGLAPWLTFATPDMSYIVANVAGGVMEFYRNPPPVGTSNQAVVFQQTGVAFPANAAITAQFRLGNSSSARKRISVLLHDSDFSDLSVCTFWLPAGAPLAIYGITTHTTEVWSNLTISFYAASAGSNGGAYLVDDVSVQYAAAGSTSSTLCDDALAPTPPGGANGPDLLVNGDFGSGAVAPGWGLFGQISGAVTGGVFEFIKTAGAPAGVILQGTGQAVAAQDIVTATFQLGNSSGVRKRVTVLLHDNTFGDLSACTFWLAPGQALATFTMRTYATQGWTNATVSVYPSTAGSDQWSRLDNVTFRRTPSTAVAGTDCVEP